MLLTLIIGLLADLTALKEASDLENFLFQANHLFSKIFANPVCYPKSEIRNILFHIQDGLDNYPSAFTHVFGFLLIWFYELSKNSGLHVGQELGLCVTFLNTITEKVDLHRYKAMNLTMRFILDHGRMTRYDTSFPMRIRRKQFYNYCYYLHEFIRVQLQNWRLRTNYFYQMALRDLKYKVLELMSSNIDDNRVSQAFLSLPWDVI